MLSVVLKCLENYELYILITKTLSKFNFYFRFQELRRDLQTVISTRTHFNIMHIEDYGGETFLSEYVASSLIQEFNQALDRCCTVFIICRFDSVLIS